MTPETRRILMYSHDGMGIGHVRRNLLIAGAISEAAPDTSILLIAGVCEAGAFRMPPRVDCLTVPSLCKDGDGGYQARRLSVTRDRVMKIRAQTIRAAAEAFDPHAMIVDKVPRGVAGELEDTLRVLRRDHHTKCVLGLRDILDEPHAVRRDWIRDGNESAIEQFYDSVWVYGDRSLYDPAHEYGWSQQTAAKIRYTGYLERTTNAARIVPGSSEDAEVRAGLNLPAQVRVILCLVGGGEDGATLAEAFAAAPLPPEAIGVILSGPLMPPAARERLARMVDQKAGQLKVIDFLPDPAPLIRLADRAVAMGGYNCVGELLCAGTPALIVPRVHPRHEQWIRASRLAERGLIDVLHPHVLSPAAIGTWLFRAVENTRMKATAELDFGGLAQIPRLLDALLASDGAADGAVHAVATGASVGARVTVKLPALRAGALQPTTKVIA